MRPPLPANEQGFDHTMSLAMNASQKSSLSQSKTPPSPYESWLEKEGVPILRGLIVPDVGGDLPMQTWRRKGVKGAMINLLGGDESMDAYVIEIPPTENTKPEKCMFEEVIVILSGRGATTIWLEGGKKQTLEWQEGSVFSPPMNCWRQHFNRSADGPVRMTGITTAPIMINLYRNAHFVFNCDHAFMDRFSAEDDYFSGKGKAAGDGIWSMNFIPDINTFTLEDWSWRGAGGTGIVFEMANNTIESHIAQFPVGTYKKAHRHGAGAHILILSGKGFSLMWEEGKRKQKVDWARGSIFAPPDMWFHQHFNSGTEPVRYFAVTYRYWRFVIKNLGMENGRLQPQHEIQYEQEDSDVLETFVSELAKRGLKPEPVDRWRK
jgi:gentisate 1,2-dioxygenase